MWIYNWYDNYLYTKKHIKGIAVEIMEWIGLQQLTH
ncbi:hypothetical protein Xhom_04792 [Xenorhabdus hominickii]|uniref:Uncharacterized protein n=1 Tax=Xenorhabdus hominickii TaxID=351679 RepID=A0A1V0M4G9_XENHO|nr:hypothetical protein [Xenorhabdus hominickii]PHM51799.1 hypothetical protein Xhom_04792 [Xenorhabdus hominickii]